MSSFSIEFWAWLLRERDIQTGLFLESTLPLRNPYFNLRNHRKILVVDGRTGFTGGLNIRESCLLELNPDHPTQDLHFRLEGNVVRSLMDTFALAEARQRVRILSPYFLPDPTLIAALSVAVLRGIEVEILVPEKSNLRFVHWAATAQAEQLLGGGCRIVLTRPPFDHTRLMLVDNAWCLFGSANWDPRSLRLNFEFNVECYDQALSTWLHRFVDGKVRSGRELTIGELQARPWRHKIRDGIARLFSPYL